MSMTVSSPRAFNSLRRPTILSIGGSDSAGLSGIQMDLRTANAFQVHCATAITANTAQNNRHVISTNPTSPLTLDQQINAVLSLNPSAIKLGLIHSKEQADIIKQHIEIRDTPSVFDPVLQSSSGNQFIDDSLLGYLIEHLLPKISLTTPNKLEAERLAGITISSSRDVEMAAQRLLHMGCKNVLIKGGHLNGKWAQDFFCNHHTHFWLSSPRRTYDNTRGTGCALATAISSSISLGYNMLDAVILGKMAINQGLRKGYQVSTEPAQEASQQGPICITEFPGHPIDLPYLTSTADADFDCSPFPPCSFHNKAYSNNLGLTVSTPPLGLYPVVDSANWLARLLPLGVTTIQLRIKNLSGEALINEIEKAIDICNQYPCRLFINDHWQIAINKGAYGVHLGQDDLKHADISAIRNAGLRLGISTHCHHEVALAHSYKPSYIACGPIFPTTTKDMPWTPHAISGLKYWQACLDYPLVAIGGINIHNIKSISTTQVSGIALITAITNAKYPEKATKALIEQCSHTHTSENNEIAS